MIRKSLPRKCLCEGSILIIKATTLFYLVKKLNFSQLNPCSGCMMDVTSVTKEDDVSKQLSTSQEGPFKRILLITRSSGINGQSVVSRMLGPITQLLSLRASKKVLRVPVSAGLLPLRLWCHLSIVVDSRISPTRLATNTGNFSAEFSHCNTVVLSVHMVNADKKGCHYVIFQSCGEKSSLKL